jgi:hypothetical protein
VRCHRVRELRDCVHEWRGGVRDLRASTRELRGRGPCTVIAFARGEAAFARSVAAFANSVAALAGSVAAFASSVTAFAAGEVPGASTAETRPRPRGCPQAASHERPNRPKKSYAPLVHAASRKVRLALYEGYRAFVAAYREAAEKLRAGDRAAIFPAGCFPPALPFVGARELSDSARELGDSASQRSGWKIQGGQTFPLPRARRRGARSQMAARTSGLLRTDLSFPQILPARSSPSG